MPTFSFRKKSRETRRRAVKFGAAAREANRGPRAGKGAMSYDRAIVSWRRRAVAVLHPQGGGIPAQGLACFGGIVLPVVV